MQMYVRCKKNCFVRCFVKIFTFYIKICYTMSNKNILTKMRKSHEKYIINERCRLNDLNDIL